MKNPERVAQLLAELRELADNDFERHRIDVLERDLTAPPTVEVIDEHHQRFNGETYGKNNHNRFCCSGALHRAIWIYFCGEIPTGYHVHHIDNNKNNNSISNLTLLSETDHHHLHMPKGTHPPKQKKKFICEVCGKEYEAFNVGINRFCSTKCQNQFNRAKMPKHELICEWCGKKFFATTVKARFCSRHCIGAARRITSQITKVCPICGKQFCVKKSSRQKCCSKECMYKSLSQQFAKPKQ